MLAIATVLATIYAGYVGAPWWGILISSLTMLLVLATTHLEVEHRLERAVPLTSVFATFLPHCLFAGFSAYGVGAVLKLTGAI